jgi:antitoxin VapB
MAFYVKDDATDAAVRRLARLTNKSLTETIRHAVESEYARHQRMTSLSERLQPLIERYRAYPATGQDADKTFFDALSGDD